MTKDETTKTASTDAPVETIKKEEDTSASTVKEEESASASAVKEEEGTTPSTVKDEEMTTAAPIDEETVKAVAERLRFFFSDANIRVDRYLRHFLKKGKDDFTGSVPVDDLIRFNSIKKYGTDPAIVIAAAKSIGDFLEVVESGKALARVKPFTTADMDGNVPLTLVVKNLPTGKNPKNQRYTRYETSVTEVTAMFEEYGKVALVRLLFEKVLDRKGRTLYNKRGPPKGKALVEFASLESLQKAAAELVTYQDGKEVEPKKPLELKGNKLAVMLLTEHIEVKAKRDAEAEQNEKVNGTNGQNGSNSKKRKEPPTDGNNQNGDKDGDTKQIAVDKLFSIDWKPGCVIELKGLPEGCDREAIRDAIKDHTSINLYADYSRGQKNGALRFSEPSDDVKTVAEKLAKGEIKISDGAVESAKVLEGDEEKKYWDTFIEFKRKQQRHRAEERGGWKKPRR